MIYYQKIPPPLSGFGNFRMPWGVSPSRMHRKVLLSGAHAQ
jgi:hypothetical protein